MKTKLKKYFLIAIALCCTLSSNHFTVMAQEIKGERSISSNSVLGYKYTQYSTSDYATFTSAGTVLDYSTIVAEISGKAAIYANDFIDAIDNAKSSYSLMSKKVTSAQVFGIITILASGPLPAAGFATAIITLDLTAEAEMLAIEVNDYLSDAERAFSYLYRYRVIENGGCVTISGQEICPMLL